MLNIALLTEMSTFFLNYREMQDNKASSEPLHVANQATFFLAYTAIRMLLAPYCYLIYVRTIYYTYNIIPLWR